MAHVQADSVEADLEVGLDGMAGGWKEELQMSEVICGVAQNMASAETEYLSFAGALAVNWLL